MDIYFDKKKNTQMVELQNQEVNNNDKKEKKEGERLNQDKINNPYENYNKNEAHEKKMNEMLEGSDPKITIAYRNNIEFDMSTIKREIRMKKEDKVEMEKIRRWSVKINNIYITPLLKMIDPFLQFTIGGNFMVNVYKNKKGETYKIPAGKRGYTDKTEVLLNVNTPQEDGQRGGRTPFQKVIEIEMRMSYSMINKQKIMVELWEHNNFWMNEIHSYLTIPLIDIVNGNANIGEVLTQREPGRKNPVPLAYVEFNCAFQEIWDFNLSFVNWKCPNLVNPKKKIDPNDEKLTTKVEIKLLGSVNSAIHSTTTSEVVKNSNNPIWKEFNHKLLFRGTVSELENEEVRITVYDASGLFNHVISSKVVGLRGMVDSEKLKTEMIVRDKVGGDNFPITVEGMVTLDSKPRYKQLGQNVILLSSRKYLVIKIMRVENIRPAENKGIVDSFISVEWCGMNQRTRTIYENNNPSYNELLYFQVPIQEDWLRDIDKYLLKINEELSTKNEVSFNLMIEGDDNTYDNFGIGYFYLSEIKGGNKMQEKFYAEDLKKERKYLSEKYTGKIKLVSAFSQSNNTFLHFEAWFLENWPPTVDFGEKKKKKERADKIPIELSKYFQRGNDPFNKEFKNKINATFLKYSNYPCKDRMFTNLTPQDQYTNKHLLPYFLCPLSVPEKKYTRKDIETNPNFFDCNINTLYEAAHYARCFPYPQDLKNDIWSSPDFMLKLRKGNVEEHAILMACLMLGIKKKNQVGKGFKSIEDLIDNSEANDDENSILLQQTDGTPNPTPGTREGKTNKGTTKGDVSTTINPKDIIFEEVEDSFPFENRIFVCQGKLRETKQPHTWVMSISTDYRDITFWDPKLFIQFELKGRVKDPDKLRKFLKGMFPNYESVQRNATEEYQPPEEEEDGAKKKKNKRKELDNIVLKGTNNDSFAVYDAEDDLVDININDSGDGRMGNNPMVDDIIANQNLNNEDKKGETFNFVDHDKTIDEEISKGNEKNFLPVDIFKDSSGQAVEEIILPYETIDLIFNQNNIYANCQFHSPEQIYYNLYEKSQWLPYFMVDNNIWRGKFEPFYSVCNFGPVYSPSLVKKMTDALVKEMRVGIAAARSGKNLPTRFKKKNEVINKQLGKYLDLLENRHLNRISEKEFMNQKQDWEVVVKKYMPKFYRMEAQSIFFNFFETEIIRREITDDLEDFWYSKIKNIVFATSARVYAYPNQIVSVRIMLAKIYRIPLEDIKSKEEEKEYHEMLKEDPNKLVEEEVDSDDEEEKKEIEAAKQATEKEKKDGKTTKKDDIEKTKVVDKPITVDNANTTNGGTDDNNKNTNGKTNK